MVKISLNLNGKDFKIQCHSMARLIDIIRHDLKLTGTKEGCGEGECGACSVLIDGELVNSCLIPAMQVEGKKIVTIEGIEMDPRLKKIQESMVQLGGAQCGICTPGMVVASAHLMQNNSSPSRQEICEGLAGNLCRCTGYAKIVDAVQDAVKGDQR